MTSKALTDIAFNYNSDYKVESEHVEIVDNDYDSIETMLDSNLINEVEVLSVSADILEAALTGKVIAIMNSNGSCILLSLEE